MEEGVIDLEKESKNKIDVLRSILTSPLSPSQSENINTRKNSVQMSSTNKRYPKEKHTLKLAFMSKSSSKCLSEYSSTSFKSYSKRRRQSRIRNFKHQRENSLNSRISSTFGWSNKSSTHNHNIKQEGNGLSEFRIKVCRKIYKILTREFSQTATEAKKLTVQIENRVNFFFNSDISKRRYIDVIKSIFKQLQVNTNLKLGQNLTFQ